MTQDQEPKSNNTTPCHSKMIRSNSDSNDATEGATSKSKNKGKRRSSMPSDNDVDIDLDLRRNYQNAVDCLIQCESVISTLQHQLVTKDERISSLEERIVQMSLEMASLKAFEDEHRGKRRVLTNVLRNTLSDDDIVKKLSAKNLQKNSQATDDRRHNHSWSRLGCSGWGLGTAPASPVDCSDLTKSTSSANSDSTATTYLDDSCVSSSGKMSINNIGQLFRKGLHQETAHKVVSDVENDEKNNEGKQATILTEPMQQQPRRRPPNRRRTEHLHLKSSSRSFLEESGVVFPASFEEVLSKGCYLTLRDSLNVQKGLSCEERKSLEHDV